MKCELQIKKLKDLCIDGKGKYGIPASAVPFDESLYTYLRITDITDDGRLNKSGLVSVDDAKAQQYILQPNDIVFARTGGSTGRNYFYDGSDGELVYAGFLIKFSIDPQMVNPRYIKYYCQSQLYKDWVNSFNTGSTRGNINAQTFANMEIPVPQRDQQDLLVQMLSVLDHKIDLNNKINANLQQQAQAIFKSWFVDFEPFQDGEFVESELGPIPKGWRVGSVADIVNLHDSKRIPLSGAQRQRMEKKIYPYYGAASLMDYVENYIFDGIYLLLGEDGTVMDDKGYPILQYVWGKFWVNNHAHVLTGKCGYSVESLYLLFLNTPVKSIVTGAVQAKISQSNLKAIQIIVPPQEVLDRFNELIQPYFSMIRQKGEENKRLENLRDTLLPKLMNGEIDIIKD